MTMVSDTSLISSDNMVMLLVSLIILVSSLMHLLAAEFGYIVGSPTGPDRWGDLKEEWATCKTRKKQSPINLIKREAVLEPFLGRVTTSYRPSTATLRNKGYDIDLFWSQDPCPGSLLINGITYKLQQVHWHSPSEHTIDGQRFPLELHMVHRNTDNKLAVLAVLYKFGLFPVPFLEQLENGIRQIANMEDGETDVGIKDPNNIGLSLLLNYYRYNGSLTTPPCNETVLWTVFNKVKTVSRKQVALLKDAVNDDASNNARPIQPTNGRPVLYHPFLI